MRCSHVMKPDLLHEKKDYAFTSLAVNPTELARSKNLTVFKSVFLLPVPHLMP